MKKVAIVPNTKKDTDLFLTKKIIALLVSYGVEVFISDAFIPYDLTGVNFVGKNFLFSDVQLIITIGGDGTILSIADEASMANVPVLGINLGRMGFMAELEPDEIDLLKNVICGRVSLEKRMMLDVNVLHEGKIVSSHKALNDIVVSNGVVSKMAELELYCSDTYVSKFHSDGVIISTPTGSTAYSLSAGGAIIDPTIDCILCTPVCPHSFYNSRSIVFSPKCVLKIKNVQKEENTYLTVDGRKNEKLYYLDEVDVRPSINSISLVKIKNKGFYDIVYNKLSERK